MPHPSHQLLILLPWSVFALAAALKAEYARVEAGRRSTVELARELEQAGHTQSAVEQTGYHCAVHGPGSHATPVVLP